MPLVTLTNVEKAEIWKIMAQYANMSLKLQWGPFRPSVKVRAILDALIGAQ